MPTWLLTWNPKKWSQWHNLPSQAKKTREGAVVTGDWSCGNTNAIQRDDRLFLMRQGQVQRGLLASGWAKASPFPGPHWSGDPSKTAQYVACEFDRILDPAVEAPLPADLLNHGKLASVHWGTQKSGIRIPDEAVPVLEKLWAKHIKRPPPRATAGIEIDEEVAAFEGEQRPRFILHRQRERRLRDAKINRVLAATGRLRCEVPGCEFDFFEVYGAAGEEFAHVHHRRPLSSHNGAKAVGLNDLAVVCANCHAIIHRRGKCRPLKGLIKRSARLVHRPRRP